MPKYIYGYIVASLADIGDLNARVDPKGDQTVIRNFEQVYKGVQEKLKGVPLQEQRWNTGIAKQNTEPVLVLGIKHEKGTTLPEIPAKLTGVFPRQEKLDLPLMYND